MQALRRELASGAPRYAAPLLACAIIVSWALLLASLHPAQYADSIEQYNWAHALEWGYWKHPPLSTWMMHGAIALIGPTHWTAPLLSALCVSASVVFVWQLARLVLPQRAANLAIVIFPLNAAFSVRADVYNHNTVLVLCCSAIAWAGARAALRGRTRDWLLAGLLAGLGLLAKYTALVTIVGVLLAVWCSGRLRSAQEWRQVGLASLVASALFLPHLVWLAQHQFSTLHYIEGSATHLEPLMRGVAFGRFLLMQFGVIGFTLVALAAALLSGQRFARAAPPPRADDATARAWMIGLVGVPFAAVAVMVATSGLAPQKMWGMHMLLFLPLWLAWRIDRAPRQGGLAQRAGIATVVLSLAAMGYVVQESRGIGPQSSVHAPDPWQPAGDIARAALADWREATPCPLRLVTGGGFAAGLVSVYSGEYPPVLEEGNFEKSPWIAQEDLRTHGALEVWGPRPLAEAPRDARFAIVPGASKFGDAPAAVWWRVIAPDAACEVPLTPAALARSQPSGGSRHHG